MLGQDPGEVAERLLVVLDEEDPQRAMRSFSRGWGRGLLDERRGGDGGQLEREAGSFVPAFARRREPSAVRNDDGTTDGQAEPETAKATPGGGVALLEG